MPVIITEGMRGVDVLQFYLDGEGGVGIRGEARRAPEVIAGPGEVATLRALGGFPTVVLDGGFRRGRDRKDSDEHGEPERRDADSHRIGAEPAARPTPGRRRCGAPGSPGT